MKLTCLGCQTDFVLADGSAVESAQCPHCRIPAASSLPFSPTAIVERTPSSHPTQITGEADRPTVKLPKRIGKYDILGKAGEGGMGVVYKARHSELNRVVALKVMIAGEHAAEDTIDRFQREARSAASLQHPNIVGVHDVGREHPLYYIVMEFVDGPSLDEMIFEKSIRPEDAARMTRDLALALHYAHQRNIVHRDIKPGNILVDRHGTAKLVDFGLAKSLADDKTLTKTGEIIGTACYMPPEQASGSMRNVDAKSDIYSLGAVLYQMLTGRAPFAGDTLMGIIKQLEETDPTAPTSLVPGVPKDLETICLKAMSKEKARRYATAQDLAKDLQNFLDGAPILARPSSVFYRAGKWSRRHPALSTAAFMSAAAALAIGAMGYRNSQLQQPEPALPWAVTSIVRLLGEGDDTPRRLAEAQPYYESARHEIEEKAAKYRAEARKERRRALEKGVADLDEAIRIHPRYADAYYLRGVARQALARTDVAALDFDRAIEINPRHADAYYARFQLRMRSLRERRARSQFESESQSNDLFRQERVRAEKDIEILKTLKLKPEKALVAEARFEHFIEERNRALALADQALRENPAFADTLVVRASIKRDLAMHALPVNQARLVEGLADCDAAINYEVNNAEAYRVRAEISLALGRYDDALRDLGEMESIAPDEPQTYNDKAMVLEDDPLRSRSSEEIDRAVRRALELDPQNAMARFRRAKRVLESPGDPKEKFRTAKADLDIAIRSDPSFSLAHVLRMVCDLALEDEVAFDEDLEAYLRTFPSATKEQIDRLRTGIKKIVYFFRLRYNISETEALANEASQFLLKKKFAESEAKYREVIRRIDDDRCVAREGLTAEQRRLLRTIAHYNLACLYSLQNDADRGIEELKLAIESGYTNFDHIREDADLDAVRKHPGFEDLLRRYRK